MEQVAIDITSGKDRNRDLAFDVDPAGKQSRKGDCATRLDHELQLPKRKRDCARDLRRWHNALADERD